MTERSVPAGADAGMLEAREEAIASTGWGNQVTWRQPRNPCLWLYVVMVGYGLYYTVTLVRASIDPYAPALGLSALIFAAYAVPFWWFTTRIDRYSRQPAALAVAAFLYGGFAATWTIALHGNGAIIGLYAKWFGQAFASDWGAGLAAPFFEELGKGSGVLLLLFIAPRVIRTAYDGFIIGAFVGLGFEIIEDILYALNSAPEGFGTDQIGSSLHTVVLRLATGFSSHIAYASVFGAGLVLVVGTVAQRRRVGLGIALCSTAMLLHFLWDSTTVISGGRPGIALVLLVLFVVLALAAVVAVFRLTVRDERSAMRAVLAPEVENGALDDAELDALAGDRHDRRRLRHAQGHRSGTLRRHRLEAAHDLVDELARSGGAETDRVQFARQELIRLR
ncbi:MAG: hypothetical protein JWO46_3319 [Nocardioidaceae bacterium]|nr:hypothetical protein [Nocardioidaceae bacterium]